ncbi:efflux transporter outer membrane subunit [Legionella spiritensis]|uniref:efflux transporter outer membrane subunit n=1 Tax=Legionella spiritensis TaxID=452 RepID=UPI000F71E65B|nr:efflux transporter outer membrane subunit [Legionella spiritensis]VEG90278.1 outer membrane efflux protein [Legionella spiritensis]
MLKNLIVLSCLLLSACMVGPNYKDPKLSVADHWQQASLHKNAPVREGPLKTANWWNVFYDPTLTSLINQGYHNNLTLQIAGVRVLQTRAQLAEVVGDLYPQQQAALGNYTYNRIGGSSLQGILPPNFYTASLGFSASWEIDFWGKYRRAIQSNDANFLASIAAYDNALVSLTADIAKTYINIRTTQELIKVTKTNISLQTMSLRIADSRFRAGQTSKLDVQQAQTELAQTQASLPSLVSSLQRQKDALGVLLGITPNKVDSLLTKNYGIPKAPRRIEVGIPKETLAQRPDIHQARLEAIAQSAAIGATKANLYPAFSLAGTFTFASNTIGSSSIKDIFNWTNRNITAGPSFSWPILNYGQITNAVRVQDAAFQQALLQYMNLVLQAQQEVQDSITQYVEAKKTVYSLTVADNSAMQSTRLALIRYKEGESIYTTVLDAERQQLQIQRSLTNAKGDVSQALVALYRALGGGWQIRRGHDIVPGHIKEEMAARTNWGTLLKQQNHQPPATNSQRIKQLYLPNW